MRGTSALRKRLRAVAERESPSNSLPLLLEYDPDDIGREWCGYPTRADAVLAYGERISFCYADKESGLPTKDLPGEPYPASWCLG
ncbi:MAG: hypothetical protein Q7J24_06085 [Desulfomicrobium sp.]|nr:hypothetical protein [Desulfomicrobium sp.]